MKELLLRRMAQEEYIWMVRDKHYFGFIMKKLK